MVFPIRFSESTQTDLGEHSLKSSGFCELERVNQGGQNQPGCQTHSLPVNSAATRVAVLGLVDQALCLQQCKEWAAQRRAKEQG